MLGVFRAVAIYALVLLTACSAHNPPSRVQEPLTHVDANERERSSAEGRTTRPAPLFDLGGPADIAALGEITDVAASRPEEGRRIDVLGARGWLSVDTSSLAVTDVVPLDAVQPGDNAAWAPNRWVRFRDFHEPRIVKDAGLGFVGPK